MCVLARALWVAGLAVGPLSAQRELERLGPLGEAAIPEYVRLVGDPDTTTAVAAGAARNLARFDYEAARVAVPVLLATLRTGDPSVTDEAMRTLRRWDHDVVEPVRALWVGGTRRERELAGALLGAIGPGRACRGGLGVFRPC